MLFRSIAAGEQAAALTVFERCRMAIAQRLGAHPSPATLSLLTQAQSQTRTQAQTQTQGGLSA